LPPTETIPLAADAAAAPPPRAPGRRWRGRLRTVAWLPPLVLAVALIALVQLLVATGVIPSSSIPLPTDILSTLIDQLGTSRFWSAVGETMQGWAIGLLLAIVAAVPLGALAGMSSFVFRSTQFLVDFLRPIPPVALLPLLVLVVGIGAGIAVWEAAIGSFFPLFFATVYGVRDRDPVTDDTAHVYRLNAWMRFRFVILPGSAPFIATGLRISASIALLLVVGTEMVIGIPGLGRNIVDAQNAGDPQTTYALVVASGLLGVAIMTVFRALERRVLHWHPSQRGGGT
jgi:ABC-type nitrate/sulfonate/bicarbonate transport system permease component